MMIGRTDEGQNPLISVALTGRAVVWMPLAEPIWASGHYAASTGQTHDRIRAYHISRFNPLNPKGRRHMVLFLAPNQTIRFRPADPRAILICGHIANRCQFGK